MKITNYIYSLLAMVFLTVFVVGTIAVFAIDRTNYYRTRADLAAVQSSELIDFARSASHLSEHVTEHFFLKSKNLDEIDHGRSDMKSALTRLGVATKNETEHLRTRDEIAMEQEDVVRIEKLQATFKKVEEQIAELLQLEKQGKPLEAMQQLELMFVNQTMRTFDDILVEAIDEERNEAAEARRVAEEYWIWLRRAAIVVTGLLFCVVAAMSFGLLRKINQPITALTAGVEAFAEGRFDHRITIQSQDELGGLAKSFNQMAETLEENAAAQRDVKNEMTRRVDERTIDVRQKAKALDEANARLAKIDKSRTQFLADISHEVRTPLTTLRGEAELALRLTDKSNKPYRMALTKILSVSETIGKLVDDLLFLARSESDIIRFETQSVDVATIARAVLDDAAVLAKTKNIVIRKMFFEQATARVEGDPSRIKQALLIGLDNAIKFSPPGKHVDFVMAASATIVDFTIRDSGPGLAEEDAPFVFERFYRSKHEASLPGGFGLGLSIAKWVVDKHSGTISLKTLKNGYTELKISLPLISANNLKKD